MAENKVQIPVEVTGAEQAKQKLGELGEAGGKAGAKQQAASAKETAAAKRASRSLREKYVHLEKLARTMAADARACERAAKAKGDYAAASRHAARAATNEARAVRFGSIAHGETAAKTSRVATETQKAAKAVNVFDDSARTAVRRGLGMFSPALGETVSLVNDFAKGVGRVSLQLLGFAGIGLALAGATVVFQKLREGAQKAEEAIRRTLEAQRELRKEGQALREQVREAVHAAGIGATAVGPIAAAAARRRREEGIPTEVTIGAEVAQRLFGLSPEERAEVERGLIVTPGKVEFARERAENLKRLQQLRQAARAPGAEEYARQFMEERAAGEKAEGIKAAETVGDVVDRTMQRLAKEEPGLSDREREVIERLLRGEEVERFRGVWRKIFDPLAVRVAPRRIEREVGLGQVPVGGEDRTMRELLEMAREAREAVEFPQPGPEQRVIIHAPVTNVAVQHVGPAPDLGIQSWEAGLGGE